MKRLFAVAVLLILAFFATRNKEFAVSSQNSAARINICDDVMPHIKNVIPPAVALGIISRDENMALIYVRESKWQAAGPDMRQAIAMAAFCSAHMGGIGGSQVRSHETGKTLTRVRDGTIIE